DCPHQKKFITLGWKMGPDKRYILCDSSRLPSFAVAGGRKRKDIIEQWAHERKWPGSETYHPDAYLYATEEDEDIENGVQEEGHIDEEAEMAIAQAWAMFQEFKKLEVPRIGKLARPVYKVPTSFEEARKFIKPIVEIAQPKAKPKEANIPWKDTVPVLKSAPPKLLNKNDKTQKHIDKSSAHIAELDVSPNGVNSEDDEVAESEEPMAPSVKRPFDNLKSVDRPQIPEDHIIE
ncbi:hypothetical protein L218DRAFT_951922, partial [Marasmius fiardii PR-910]